MIARRLYFLCTLLAVLALAGCADLAPARREATTSRAARTCHARIALVGRFSVQYRKDDKEESAHGNFRWGQNNSHMRIVLISPMGQTLATIDVTPESATLIDSEKESHTAEDVDALVLESLGWPLPVSGLRDWIQACMRDARGRRVIVTPESRELTTSDGWRITYPVWEEDDRGRRRPKRIDVQHIANERIVLSVRLVIDEWMPHP
ncbi:MAG: outer membrane lipoprotein LolB [Oxalobacter sp.]|nr:MAG: outer membrane lipoprotein LolB [Oxalobacter sp.]